LAENLLLGALFLISRMLKLKFFQRLFVHMALPRVFVYMPAYNVSRQISPLIMDLDRTLSELMTAGKIRDYRIICVNDGSTDGTAEVLRSLSRQLPSLEVITHRRNYGVVKATLTAMEHVVARSQPHDIAIRMDADYEHNPKDIPHLLSSLNEPRTQLCFAYLPPELGHGFRFYLLNSLIGGYENLMLFHRWIPQFCPGFFAVRVSHLRSALPEIKRAVRAYARLYSSQFIHIDVYIAYLASLKGKVEFIRASRTHSQWIFRKPFTKLDRYLDAHSKFMEFLGSRVKALKG